MKPNKRKAKPRMWKLTGRRWGIVGAAALAVVLVLAIMMMPRGEVAAWVNGERITPQEVEETQARYRAYDMTISYDQALEHMITEMILFREAEKGGYLPTLEDAESELDAQLRMRGLTKEDLEARLDMFDIPYQEHLEDFRREMAIQDYLDAVVEVPEVTREEVEQHYAYLKQTVPEDQLAPLEEIEAHLIMELEQEKHQEAVSDFIEELKEKASIKYGSPG